VWNRKRIRGLFATLAGLRRVDFLPTISGTENLLTADQQAMEGRSDDQKK
jgi:hypothetical protein